MITSTMVTINAGINYTGDRDGAIRLANNLKKSYAEKNQKMGSVVSRFVEHVEKRFCNRIAVIGHVPTEIVSKIENKQTAEVICLEKMPEIIPELIESAPVPVQKPPLYEGALPEFMKPKKSMDQVLSSLE